MTYPKGIDISAHQADTPSLVGIKFIIARATYGKYPDIKYHLHYGNRAGRYWGAYHFGRNFKYDSLEDQVSAFLKTVGDTTRVCFLDVEADGGNTPMTHAQAKEWIAAVKKAGFKVGLYASQSAFFNAGQDFNDVARWGPTPPSIPWTFWQTRGAPLDIDRFNGTEQELADFMLGPLPESDTEEPVQFAAKIERWASISPDGGPVTTIGAPLKDDGSTDFSQRLVVRPYNGRHLVELISRDRLPATSDASLDEAMFDALTSYAFPADQEAINAAVAAATAPLEAKVKDLAAKLSTATEDERNRIAEAEATRIKSL